jgi:ABC-2 type transport system ATP-binding protein
MLLGLVKPSGGAAEVLGAPVGNRELRARVGFLPEQFRFYDWLTAPELLSLHGRLCGIEDSILKERVPMLLDLVGLTPHLEKQLRNFSKGMVQRAGLAQALVNEPDVVFLDEPTSGLDPIGRRLVREIINAQREHGTTIFLNSHLLSEVECTCDRVAFIRKGEVIETRAVNEFSEKSCMVHVRGSGFPQDVVDGLHRWGSQISIARHRLSMKLDSNEDAPRVLRFLVESGLDIYEFTTKRGSLEDRFLEILGADEGL